MSDYYNFPLIKIIKSKKKAGTNFVLLSRSRNMIHENLFI